MSNFARPIRIVAVVAICLAIAAMVDAYRRPSIPPMLSLLLNEFYSELDVDAERSHEVVRDAHRLLIVVTSSIEPHARERIELFATKQGWDAFEGAADLYRELWEDLIDIPAAVEQEPALLTRGRWRGKWQAYVTYTIPSGRLICVLYIEKATLADRFPGLAGAHG